MDTVTSRDGTTIAFDRLGDGPPVVLVSGGSTDRMANAGLAAELAANHTVYNFDRRGRGDSGDTQPYAIEREIDALMSEFGDGDAALRIVLTRGGRRLLLTEPLPEHPETIGRVFNPNVEFWHSATFSYDGRRVIFASGRRSAPQQAYSGLPGRSGSGSPQTAC